MHRAKDKTQNQHARTVILQRYSLQHRATKAGTHNHVTRGQTGQLRAQNLCLVCENESKLTPYGYVDILPIKTSDLSQSPPARHRKMSQSECREEPKNPLIGSALFWGTFSATLTPVKMLLPQMKEKK